MGKVVIAGSSYVITSSISMADLETVKKFRPNSMALMEEETREQYFKVGTGSNSISDFGISFGGVSNSDEKLATATLCIPTDVEDCKEYVLDKAGLALVNLEKVEAQITAALEDIKIQREIIAANIEVSV